MTDNPKCPVPECGREMKSIGDRWYCNKIGCLAYRRMSSMTNDELARITIAPLPKPEPKPAGRIPWPEWLNDFLCIRVRTHGVHGVNIYANDALCFLGNKLWTHGPGNYRRVTVDGKDFAEKVDK